MTETYTTEERVALLTRLREQLLTQRFRFEEYLEILEQQEAAISEKNVDKLNEYVELETRIITDIAAVQRVVTPLSEVYRAVTPEPDPEILELNDSLSRLHEEASKHNKRNQELLHGQLDTLRLELDSVRSPKRARNVYSSRDTATLLDITT